MEIELARILRGLAFLFAAILPPAILWAHLARGEPTLAEVIAPDQVLSLLDSKVQRQDDKVIGRIGNVFIDNGAPHRAIINLDGFMGVGAHTAIVPWDSLRFDAKADTVTVVVDLSSEQIRTMAKLKPSEVGAPRGEAQAEPSQTAPPERGLKLIDATLTGADDKALGRVTDLLVDRAGQPRAIVVALGGTLDPKGRQVAVSWNAIHFGQGKGGPTLDSAVTRDQALAAGEYETGKPVAALLPQPASPGDQPAAPPR
jgi:PRC-barrel domain